MELRETLLLDATDPSRKAAVNVSGELLTRDATAVTAVNATTTAVGTAQTAIVSSLSDLNARVGTIATPAANTLLELLAQIIARFGLVTASPAANTLLARIKQLTDAIGDTTNLTTNQQLYSARQLLGLTTWSRSGTVGNNTTLTLTQPGAADKIHVLTWVDVNYSGSGNSNVASISFNGTTVLRPKVDNQGIIARTYHPGVATPGANQSIVLTLPAIGGFGSQSSRGAMGGLTLNV